MKVSWSGDWKTATLTAEASDDLWTLYNVVDPGDSFRAASTRKVAIGEHRKGEAETSKKRVTLTLTVTASEYDSVADCIRVSGVNALEHAHVKLGAHHTVEVGLHTRVSVRKELPQPWSKVQRNWVKKSSSSVENARKAAQLAVALIDGVQGVARLFLLTAQLVRQVGCVEVTMPKRVKAAYGEANSSKALDKFHDAILRDLLWAHLDFAATKCVAFSGPGKGRTAFLDWLDSAKHGSSNAALALRRLQAEGGLIDVPGAAAVSADAVRGLLGDPTFQARLAASSASEYVTALDAFANAERRDATRVLYGSFDAIATAAHERCAVDCLFILDDRLKTRDLVFKRKIIALIATVEKTNGRVVTFPSLHIASDRLRDRGGIAATLRFPCADLCDVADDAAPTAPPTPQRDAGGQPAPAPPPVHIEAKCKPAAKKPSTNKNRRPALNSGGHDDRYDDYAEDDYHDY